MKHLRFTTVICLIACLFKASNLLPSHEAAGATGWMAEMQRLMREAEDPRYQEPARPALNLAITNPPMALRRQREEEDRARLRLTPAALAALERQEMAEKIRMAEASAITQPTYAEVLAEFLRQVNQDTPAQTIYQTMEHILRQTASWGYNVLDDRLVTHALKYVSRVAPEQYDLMIQHFYKIKAPFVASRLQKIREPKKVIHLSTIQEHKSRF